jgi:hypothetical protein
MLFKQCNITETIKLESFLMAKNKILIRVENIADLIDGPYAYESIDLNNLAQGIYEVMNGDNIFVETTIKELSLTGNQEYSAMEARRIKWKTRDDATVHSDAEYPAETGNIIKLQQQRIRVFSIEYTEPTAFLQ